MSISKRSSAAKPAKVAPKFESAEYELDEGLIEKLANLAVELATEDEASPSLPNKQRDLRRMISKSLRQQQDDVLYEALERARELNADAHHYFREMIEETAETVFFTRNERNYEVNAFIIPMFVRTTGGLHAEQNFRDPEAFTELTDSIKEAQLESASSKVVLVSYAYHLNEIDAITYSHLEAMVRDAFAAMTDKKISATLAIERSMSSWLANSFGVEDEALELRFLLGFALKDVDDPFYAIPQKEAAMDAYFAERAQRFQAWSEKVAPFMQRCLATDGRRLDVHFLYQDLFHGGKERGIAEYFILQMMSDLDHGLQKNDLSPQQTHAVVVPMNKNGDILLRVNLYSDGNVIVATAEKPMGATRNLQVDLDDISDALLTLGVKSVALAEEFDDDGNAINALPYMN